MKLFYINSTLLISICSTLICLSLSKSTSAQSLSKTDSLQISNAIEQLFRVIAKPNYQQFKSIAASKIRCGICGTDQSSKALSKKTFFDQHLKTLGQNETWQRAARKINPKYLLENQTYSDISVFFQTYQPAEIAKGHEGAQLGVWFKREKGQLKFAGLESIP